MGKPADDFQAVRTVVEVLTPFDASDQERIIRWAREKLGLISAPESRTQQNVPQAPEGSSPQPSGGRAQGRDLEAFVNEKNPRSDVQFAATVAYYYQFEAPPDQKKAAITAEDVREACRLADRERLKNPGQTLRNGFHTGLFDRNETGSFTLNSVGENLVAMTLPGGGEKTPRKPVRRKTKRRKGKRSR